MKPQVTVVIVTFNVKDLTRNCLNSLYKYNKDLQIIVSDSGSSDGTVDMIRKEFPEVFIIDNKENIGFAKANNKAKKYCEGEYILMLNPDTVVEKDTIRECVNYMKSDEKIGALTCRIDLWNGGLDKDCRRSFPTPWVALTHFSFLDRIFPKSKFFSKYWYGFLPENEVHEIDVPQGAFCLVRKDVMDEVNWYDEDYFLDGEDIDLAYKIKELKFKIIYYPKVRILHYKGASKGKKSSGQKIKVSPEVRKRSISSGVDSMKIFYKKHYLHKYPWFLNKLVFFAIDSIKIIRLAKFRIC